ncbi:putative arabinan endo-1,5-alpha-L-arabinosidase A [Pseudocercospora fuligena]|uniref:Endo-1,5-alpha-L-arabinanase A n=1 Tax=Pseudocercospora fuligena TaxID=685502 RepID=A0A8H6VPJ0_9PEZI|nr:putative arabinan endo-1,5-alpha-L-arabinosidase A [Pseudocercospora fuligena]
MPLTPAGGLSASELFSQEALPMLLTTAVLLTSLTRSIVSQACYPQPLPIPCHGPACISDYPTPNSSLQYQDTRVIRHHESSFYYPISRGNHTGLGLNVVTAPTLSGPWTYAYQILKGPLKSPCGAANNHSGTWRWAPEIHFVNGTYCLYYTVEYPVPGEVCFDICVATSSTMGKDDWNDQGSIGIPLPEREKANDGTTRDPYVRLDGNLLSDSKDPQGVVEPLFMVFGSYQFGLYGITLANMTSVMPGERPELIIAAQYQKPASTILQDQSGNYTEGAHQLVNGDYIYLFYSRGACCEAPGHDAGSVYQTQVCRTVRSNGPRGLYVDRDGENCLTGGSLGWHRKGSIFLYSNSGERLDLRIMLEVYES